MRRVEPSGVPVGGGAEPGAGPVAAREGAPPASEEERAAVLAWQAESAEKLAEEATTCGYDDLLLTCSGDLCVYRADDWPFDLTGRIRSILREPRWIPLNMLHNGGMLPREALPCHQAAAEIPSIGVPRDARQSGYDVPVCFYTHRCRATIAELAYDDVAKEASVGPCRVLEPSW